MALAQITPVEKDLASIVKETYEAHNRAISAYALTNLLEENDSDTYRMVLAIFRRNGYPLGNMKVVPDLDEKRIVELYRENKSIFSIIQSTGFSRGVITRVLKKIGLLSNDNRRKFSFNKKFKETLRKISAGETAEFKYLHEMYDGEYIKAAARSNYAPEELIIAWQELKLPVRYFGKTVSIVFEATSSLTL